MVRSASAIAASSRVRSANRLLALFAITVSSSTASLISWLVIVFGCLGEEVGRGLEAVLHRHQRRRILRDSDSLNRLVTRWVCTSHFERAAQACDLHRDEVLDQLAHPLHGVFALVRDVEVEVVDQSDRRISELVVSRKTE